MDKTCKAMRAHFSEYLDEELPEAEKKALNLHIQQCIACRKELEEMKLMVSAVKQLPHVKAPKSFAKRVIEKAGGYGEREEKIIWLWPRTAAVAASLLLITATALLINTTSLQTPPHPMREAGITDEVHHIDAEAVDPIHEFAADAEHMDMDAYRPGRREPAERQLVSGEVLRRSPGPPGALLLPDEIEYELKENIYIYETPSLDMLAGLQEILVSQGALNITMEFEKGDEQTGFELNFEIKAGQYPILYSSLNERFRLHSSHPEESVSARALRYRGTRAFEHYGREMAEEIGSMATRPTSVLAEEAYTAGPEPEATEQEETQRYYNITINVPGE